MKYIAVLDTDEIEDFDFFEDGKEKYLHAIDANSVNGEWIYLPFKPLEHEDLGVDCISRADVLKLMKDNWHTHNGDWAMQESMDDIRALPSVTPQEPFINKLCVSEKICEHDKNVALDKIRAEITNCLKALDEIEKSGFNIYLPNEMSGRRLTYQQCLRFIDKYKEESEPQESEE